jgi:hypothetical protein
VTYEESAALMKNIPFNGRIKVAVVKYADSISIESPTVPAHNSRYKWAQSAFQQPDQTAGQIQPQVTMDSATQTAGIDAEGNALITDAALQVTVETTVNKII